MAELIAAFHRSHAQRYGYSNANRPTEAVQLRLRASGITAKPSLLPSDPTPIDTTPAPHAIRRTVFDNQSVQTSIYHRADLGPGHHGTGPAMVLTGESTNIVPPHWSWRIDPVGTLILTRAAHAH